MSDDPRGKEEDDPLQDVIGTQLKVMYESVLTEPIPDRIVELLTQLDAIDLPQNPESDDSGTADKQ
ncbi:NepR family anti-sigma factor [Acuticoccus sp. MNP-M23]|uniref:NepR family anti-sigma factor n=1 Tax=Acuticoccus sp. MNP-M23 TaxID=3072793 RepID=UPI002815FA27|nr:NepR family anti-sigma factor [Acuticoccus sp. MNP-M23]WMS42087.1 NepR family anti-sigma factor [Acuticoccus sp. MNP-M23]